MELIDLSECMRLSIARFSAVSFGTGAGPAGLGGNGLLLLSPRALPERLELLSTDDAASERGGGGSGLLKDSPEPLDLLLAVSAGAPCAAGSTLLR